jgi:hypothetical protein
MTIIFTSFPGRSPSPSGPTATRLFRRMNWNVNVQSACSGPYPPQLVGILVNCAPGPQA